MEAGVTEDLQENTVLVVELDAVGLGGGGVEQTRVFKTSVLDVNNELELQDNGDIEIIERLRASRPNELRPGVLITLFALSKHTNRY